MPTSLLAPLVTAGIGLGANALFGGGGLGGSAPQATAAPINFTPPSFNAGGLSATFGNNGYTVAPSAGRADAIGGLGGSYGDQAEFLKGLRDTVGPGIDQIATALDTLRNTRLTQLGDARSAAIGNLRENLQRRRVLGSSFAQDAASRLEAEFGRQADTITAESGLTKAQTTADLFFRGLDATNKIASEEFAARRGQFQTGLDELNLEANVAASLTGKATDALSQNARYAAMIDTNTSIENAKLTSQGQAAAGKFIAPFADAAGKGVAKLFA